MHLQGEYFERDQIKFEIFVVLCVLCPKVGYFLHRTRVIKCFNFIVLMKISLFIEKSCID